MQDTVFYFKRSKCRDSSNFSPVHRICYFRVGKYVYGHVGRSAMNGSGRGVRKTCRWNLKPEMEEQVDDQCRKKVFQQSDVEYNPIHLLNNLSR